MTDETPQHSCPIDCPNRAKEISDRQRGKAGSYIFAVFLALLTLGFSFEPTPQGWEPKEEPPIAMWFVMLPIIGTCLGVQVEPETIARLLSGLSK